MTYQIIYDGCCNLCTTLVQGLEQLDTGQQFQYIPMQDTTALAQLGITPEDCELGMILVNNAAPDQRWQGSDAAEEIGRLLPMGGAVVAAYRALPGLRWFGDRLYAQVRDRRYQLFGRRPAIYESPYRACVGNCQVDVQAANTLK